MLKALSNRQTNPLVSWQKEMNRLFDQFNRDLDLTKSDLEIFEPKVEIKDKKREYVIRAEVPGIPEEDIQATLRDNCLIIEGERKTEEEKEEKGFYRSEFSYGSFYRAIPLEDDVDEGKVNASYKRGVLTVHLAKTGRGKHGERQIPITLS